MGSTKVLRSHRLRIRAPIYVEYIFSQLRQGQKLHTPLSMMLTWAVCTAKQ